MGLGLSGYNTDYDYCSIRGDNLEDDLPSWEATDQQLRKTRKPKTTKRLLDLIFKTAADWFDMTSFPSRDGGP